MKTLDEWLSYLETLNPNKIDLGLDRSTHVFEQFNIKKIAPKVIVVAGTNGKGSTISYLESMLSASGYRVAKYISPHLFCFTERIVINSEKISSQELVNAFEYVQSKQGNTHLSYFEFITLAAFYSIYNAHVDVALLEIGLGGALDTVNIADRDINLLTNISLDHVDWLGDTRDKIAKEKLGIAKDNVPFYCADTNPPNEIKQFKNIHLIKESFGFEKGIFKNMAFELDCKNINAMLDHQKNNLALALAAVSELENQGLAINTSRLINAINGASTTARQTLLKKNDVSILVDVAHNEASVAALSDYLVNFGAEHVHAVFSVLNDKDVASMVNVAKAVINDWHIAPLNSVRTIKKENLKKIFNKNSLKYTLYKTIEESFAGAKKHYQKGDLIVVFGSFLVIDELKTTLKMT